MSVSESILLVASSIIRILAGLTMARARQNSCRCPCDNLSSLTRPSSPPLDSNNSHMPTARNASTMTSSLAISWGSTFSRTLPCKKNGSCGRVLRRLRTSSRGIVLMSMSSMEMVPEVISNRRANVDIRDDLPLEMDQPC